MRHDRMLETRILKGGVMSGEPHAALPNPRGSPTLNRLNRLRPLEQPPIADSRRWAAASLNQPLVGDPVGYAVT